MSKQPNKDTPPTLDPLTAAISHLRAAVGDLGKLLDPPYKLTDTQKLKVLREIKRLYQIQDRLQPLKKKIPPNPPAMLFEQK